MVIIHRRIPDFRKNYSFHFIFPYFFSLVTQINNNENVHFYYFHCFIFVILSSALIFLLYFVHIFCWDCQARGPGNSNICITTCAFCAIHPKTFLSLLQDTGLSGLSVLYCIKVARQGSKGYKGAWVKCSKGQHRDKVFSRTHFRPSLTPEEGQSCSYYH